MQDSACLLILCFHFFLLAIYGSTWHNVPSENNQVVCSGGYSCFNERGCHGEWLLNCGPIMASQWDTSITYSRVVIRQSESAWLSAVVCQVRSTACLWTGEKKAGEWDKHKRRFFFLIRYRQEIYWDLRISNRYVIIDYLQIILKKVSGLCIRINQRWFLTVLAFNSICLKTISPVRSSRERHIGERLCATN